ncbi:triose-phosphate transporter family-domain-containing protein [Zopfochytrium polystomum]|nr:triose-phosphate transporter family-domain-containing protein [Zopfochytrium polystomum]
MIVQLFSLALWYVLSALLSLYNKSLLGKDQYDFNYPLLVSGIHAMSHFVVSWLLMFQLCSGPFPPPKKETGEHNFWKQVKMIAPTALCTALDIGLSNASLHYISLSFYTIVKSTVPLWVLIFSLLFGLERFRWNLVFIIGIICTGVAFTAAGEVHFSWYGFILIQLASMSSGLRWSLTQMLLPRAAGTSHPVATLYRLSPFTFAFFLVGSLLTETGDDGFQHSPFFADLESAVQAVSFITIGGLIALMMTLSQFYFVQRTSVLTFSVAVGNFQSRLHDRRVHHLHGRHTHSDGPGRPFSQYGGHQLVHFSQNG